MSGIKSWIKSTLSGESAGCTASSGRRDMLRSTRDYDDDDRTGPKYVDHFTLGHPSSTVKYRGARVHVYDATSEQFLLEDRRSAADVARSKHNLMDGVGDDGEGNEDAEGSGGGGGNSNSEWHQHRHTITVKRMPWASFGLRVLRLAYTLVSILLVGYFFVLCFQIILFLFLNLPVESGATSLTNERRPMMVVGIIFSIPIFLFGMASLMAIGTAFAGDAWRGGVLMKSVFGWSSILTECLYFTFYLVIPALVFAFALMIGVNNPWEICVYSWVACVVLAFCSFGLAVVWREIKTCFDLIDVYYPSDDEDRTWKRFLFKIERAIFLTQNKKYAGHEDKRFLVSGDDQPPENGYSFDPDFKPLQVKRGPYSRLTSLACCKMYDNLDPHIRLYTTDEIRDVLPFITKYNWSLEAMCCRKHNSRTISAAKGPSALTPGQVMATVVGNLVGAVLVTLFVIGLLLWVQAGTLFYVIAALICVVCCIFPVARSSVRMYKVYRDINNDIAYAEANYEEYLDEQELLASEEDTGDRVTDEGLGGSDGEEKEDDTEKPEASEKGTGVRFDEEASKNIMESRNKIKEKEQTTMFQLWETVRITQPRPWVSYLGIVCEFAFLLLWPVITLFTGKNYNIAAIFLIFAIFSFLRVYFDASTLLAELGCLDNIEVQKDSHLPSQKRGLQRMFTRRSLVGPDKTLVKKARMSEIIGDITRSTSVGRWMWVFGLLIFVCFLLFVSALGSDDVQPGQRADRPPIVLVDDFYYPGEQGSLQYPSCKLSKGFQIPGGGDSMLGDYAFMSALAYERTQVTGYLLPQWFGEGGAVDQAELVGAWRIQNDNMDNPVSFKLFTFPPQPGFGVVSIRGSETSWDWLVNMQLWSASGLAQTVKWLLPYGWIWDPFLDELVYFVNWVQTNTIKKVSYYRVTTAFVNDLFTEYGRDSYDTLRVTGASLGGGLAIITGAQTNAPAVAISGPNVELSRNTVTPPVTMDQINRNVFDFVPDRDYIVRLGGRARNAQEAECLAPNSNLFGCHSMWRSVCEIQYRCGSNGRPFICRCVQKFGYPLPTQNGTRSLELACEEQEQAFLNATNSTRTSSD